MFGDSRQSWSVVHDEKAEEKAIEAIFREATPDQKPAQRAKSRTVERNTATRPA